MPKKVIRKKSPSRHRRQPRTHGHFINIFFPLIIATLLLISLILHRTGVLGTSTTNKSAVRTITYKGQLFTVTYPQSWQIDQPKRSTDLYMYKYIPEKVSLGYADVAATMGASIGFAAYNPSSQLGTTLADNKRIQMQEKNGKTVEDTIINGQKAIVISYTNTYIDGKAYVVYKGKYLYMATLTIFKQGEEKNSTVALTSNKLLTNTFDRIAQNYWKLTPENNPPLPTIYPTPTSYVIKGSPPPTIAMTTRTTPTKDCATHPVKDAYSVTILTSQTSTGKINYIPTGSVTSLPYANFSFILCPTSNLNAETVAPFVYSKQGTTTQFNAKPFFPEESTTNIVKTQTSKKSDGSVWVTPTSGSFPKNSQLVLIFKMSTGLSYVYRLFTN